MTTTFNDISASMKFILGLAGTLMVAVMRGGYGYTASVTDEIKKERHIWRDEHNKAVSQQIQEIKIEQKESRKEINRKFERLEERQERAYDKIGDKLEKLLEQNRGTQ